MPQQSARDGEILSEFIRLDLPIAQSARTKLKVGDIVSVFGTLYTARDQAHKRIAAAINAGEKLPFPLNGATIYYCGPTPKKDGEIIGSCGPTTSGRMDSFTPLLLKNGLSCMIGKGVRSDEVKQSIIAHNAIYLTAIGGAAALYASKVKSAELIAYPDLGCEAVYKLYVEDFPAVVAIL